MGIFDNDQNKGWPVFPTRVGGSAGRNLERQMLGKVGGADSIRTEIQQLPDGSTVMLRTRNGFPEFTRTPAAKAVEEVYSNWAWPWHGVWTGTTNILETPGGSVDGPGHYPETSNFNFLPHAVGSYAAISAPSVGVEYATWVNWAAVSGGVLFGVNVGMNTWLCVVGGATYVVSMVISSTYTATFTFYTLDNWVAGCNVELAPLWVKYDKAPTPYMAKAVPAGSLRVPVKTIVVTLPMYFGSLVGDLRIKRSDVSADGRKIILAYELAGGAGVTQIPEHPSNDTCLMLEDMWVEATISADGELAVQTAVLREGCVVTPGSREHSLSITSNSPPYGVPFTPASTFTASVSMPSDGVGEWVVGYMYTPEGVAQPVTFAWDEHVDDGTNFYTCFSPKNYRGTRVYAVAGSATIAFGGHSKVVTYSKTTTDEWYTNAASTTKATTWELNVGGRELSGSEQVPLTDLAPWRYGGDTTPWPTDGYHPVTGVRVSLLGNSAGKVPIYFGGSTYYYFDGITASYTEQLDSPPSISQFNTPLTPPWGAPVSPDSTGETRHMPYAVTFLGVFTDKVSESDSGTYRVRIRRDAFNCLTISLARLNVAAGQQEQDEPVAHLLPSGWIDVAAGSVTKAAFELGVAGNEVSGAVVYGNSSGMKRYHV